MSQMQLGRLPRPEGQPSLVLRSLVPGAALPPYPPELHNIEKALEPSLLGNDVWGDCVFVSIEMNRRIAAAALGIAVAHLTAAEVVARYKAFTGISTPPGPGAVILNALNWVRKDPAGWGGNHLLFYADVPHSEEALRQACSEFGSVITGELIRAAQEYPARQWIHTTTAVLGGHATPGGTYTALLDFLRTWGYIVTVDPSFFAADIDEIVVCVWDFMWKMLSYERQVQLIADLQALTGKPWTGPAPVQPPPPSVLIPEGPMSALKPLFRLFDGAIPAKTIVKVQAAGVGPIPAATIELETILRVDQATEDGWVYAGPDPAPRVFGLDPITANGVPSIFDFHPGPAQDGFPRLLLEAGQLWIWSTVAIPRLVVDVTHV